MKKLELNKFEIKNKFSKSSFYLITKAIFTKLMIIKVSLNSYLYSNDSELFIPNTDLRFSNKSYFCTLQFYVCSERFNYLVSDDKKLIDAVN